MLEQLFSRRRAFAIVLIGVAIGPLMPAPKPAQASTIEPPTCAELLAPEELADLDPEDLLFIVANCPGALLRAKAEERREVVRAPDLLIREREEDSFVRLPKDTPAGLTEPITNAEPDLTSLADTAGFAIKQENETVVIDRPGFRSEVREEETKVRGDDFNYRLEESREETDVAGVRSDERESEERFSGR